MEFDKDYPCDFCLTNTNTLLVSLPGRKMSNAGSATDSNITLYKNTAINYTCENVEKNK